MTHPEHSSKTARASTGLFATLRALLGCTGPLCPSHRPASSCVHRAAVLVAVFAALLATASPALASGPPRFDPTSLKHELYPTRLRVRALLTSEELETTWQAEYTTEPANPASWEVVNTDTVPAGLNSGGGIEIGTQARPEALFPLYLRHLNPETVYYVRFQAENKDGEAEEGPVELKTLSIAKPEIIQTGFDFPLAGGSTFRAEPSGAHSAHAEAGIESNGAQTEYEFAYSASEAGPWTPCASGTVTVAQDFAFPEAACTGLAPETSYFARIKLTNEKGTAEEVKQFTTYTAKPAPTAPDLRNPTATSVHLSGFVAPHGSKTTWRLEYATNEEALKNCPGGVSCTGVTVGGEGTISQAEAEALPFNGGTNVEGALTTLAPATTYYVRLFAENECEAGCGSATSGITSFETSGPPIPTTFAVHAIHGEFLRLLAAVNPHSLPTSEEQTISIEGSPTGGTFTLGFEGHTTAAINFNASAEALRLALENLPGGPQVSVRGPAGGPFLVLFVGPDGETDEPQIGCDASGLEPPTATCTVETTQQGGEAYDTHYHFEYEGQKEGAEPFAHATSTPVLDLGSGDTPKFLGTDLPALTPGETYRYRISATNTFPGNPVVEGQEQTLIVPNPTVEPQPVCENERFRTGPSGHLPDCRGYEQLSPIDKEGAQEALKYGITGTGTVPGEDGDHFMFMTTRTRWGSGPAAGQAPYFFSRTPAGWQMTAGIAQPEAGFDQYSPQLLNPDLTQFGFSSRWTTGTGGEETGVSSPEVEFKAGPPGGPYATVAAVKRKLRTEWAAASEDFSKLVLATEDHTLLGNNTGTKQGSSDLYGYSGGELDQENVDSAGHTIGSCGAAVVKGDEGSSPGRPASRHAVSADGSRVFFEAVPTGLACSEPPHLYMREAAASRTLDIGAYKFAAANMQGTEVLLENPAGEDFLYETGPGALRPLLTGGSEPRPLDVGRDATVSANFTEIYFGGLSRYDIATETLRFVIQVAPPNSKATGGQVAAAGGEPSSDGRFLYFESARVAGLPGGGPELHEGGAEGPAPSEQLYRYDSAENVVQCISCASPFDPEPKLGVDNSGGSFGTEWPVEGVPAHVFASADGRYAFFETPSALLPQDVNGEIPPEPLGGERTNGTPSNDVYEWRRDGVDGCAALQGCISLITPGTDGWLVALLGTDASGRNVFFYTSSQLLPQDNDTAGDFYDARIGGGFAEPSEPIRCKGDSCHPIVPAPNDETPGSLTYHGPGNERSKPPRCKKGFLLKHGHCVKRHKPRKHRQSTRKRAGSNHGGHK